MSFCTGCWIKAVLSKTKPTNIEITSFVTSVVEMKTNWGFEGNFAFLLLLNLPLFISLLKHLIFFSCRSEAESPFFLVITATFPKSHILFLQKDWNIFFLKQQSYFFPFFLFFPPLTISQSLGEEDLLSFILPSSKILWTASRSSVWRAVGETAAAGLC